MEGSHSTPWCDIEIQGESIFREGDDEVDYEIKGITGSDSVGDGNSVEMIVCGLIKPILYTSKYKKSINNIISVSLRLNPQG